MALHCPLGVDYRVRPPRSRPARPPVFMAYHWALGHGVSWGLFYLYCALTGLAIPTGGGGVARPPTADAPGAGQGCADAVPPDLPIGPRAAELSPTTQRLRWLHDGSPLLQGWGVPYQTMLVEQAAANASFIQALKDSFGFSSVILNVPGCSGNGGAPPTLFKRALQAYQQAGIGVVLYSSIVHAGEDPVWTSGNLSRDHPSWLQRHYDGTPWLLETKPALTPASDDALSFTLNRTLGLVRQFPEASAVMLDNSELCPGTAICDYSTAALQKWRTYLIARFPAEWAARCLGVIDRATAPLPTTPGTPLFGVFANFRNRLTAAGLQRFRSVLHALESPGPVGLFANTELEWPDLALATRLQPAHEDAILTESYDTGAQAVDKAMLSSALAPRPDFPVYNFLGSFNRTDYHHLLPPLDLLSQVAATLMARAKPWVVYYGLDTASESRTVLMQLLQFRAANPQLFTHENVSLLSVAPLAAVVSPLSTELQGEAQIGSWFEQARELGVPVCLISSERLCSELPNMQLRVLLMQNVAVMPRDVADCVNDWIASSGGIVVRHNTSTAMFDEIGQRRAASALLPSERLLHNPTKILGPTALVVVDALRWAASSTRWQLTPYANSSTLVLHGLALDNGDRPPSSCPKTNPYPYGTKAAGRYCCSLPATTTCKGTVCCETPGTSSGCQGNPRCKNNTVVSVATSGVGRAGMEAGDSVEKAVQCWRPGATSLTMTIPLAQLLHRSGAPPSANVQLWAPASAGTSSRAAAIAAGLESWMKDGDLIVKMAAAPLYFILAAELER